MARIILQYRDAQRDPAPMTLIHTPAMPDEAARRRSIAFLNLAHGLDHFLLLLSGAMFALGMFAAIYHPVGMAMLIEASQARGRTLAFNGVCGNLGVSLAAGISGALASWIGWRAAFIAPALVSIASGTVYLWLTPDDRHHAAGRKSVPAMPLTPRMAVPFFGLFIVIALTAGVTFNVLTIALPKIVDERLARD